MCRNGKNVVILRTAHGVCLLLLSASLLRTRVQALIVRYHRVMLVKLRLVLISLTSELPQRENGYISTLSTG